MAYSANNFGAQLLLTLALPLTLTVNLTVTLAVTLAVTITVTLTLTPGAQLFPRNEGPKLLIGVHDKRTGVVRLVPAQHLYQMKTLVKQPRLPLDPPAPDPVQLVGAEAGRAMQEGKRALVSELGSAKAHKKQKSPYP